MNAAPKLVTVFPSLEIIDEDKLTLKLLGSAVTVVSDLIFKLLEKAAKPNVIVPISAIKILNKSFPFV